MRLEWRRTGRSVTIRDAMAVERPEDKLVPIAIETFGRTGKMAQEFLRDSCKHILHRSQKLKDARSQMNPKLRQGNAEIAIGARAPIAISPQTVGPVGQSAGPSIFFRT
uniref:Uncharacterized protein n=1 Tax=Rhodosorus marinus TaxID=101924 RepID=A0A7S2ZUQ5_9RHOD|mmetsp:Transcript_31839/g.123587  ORF Transcript_31839/g.123587 Transcript_31839/m.123587 type:complete len:109 (+) Transcript_31839:101-427(+)